MQHFLVSLLLLAMPLIAAPVSAAASHDGSLHDGSLNDPNIRYVGRWDKSSPAVYHGYWSGVYLRTGFTGTSIGIKLAEATELAVSVDGEAQRTVSAGAGTTALNLAPLKVGQHTLMVGSAGQNYEVAFQGLVLDAAATTLLVPAPSHHRNCRRLHFHRRGGRLRLAGRRNARL